jgi:hypothetical protein
VVPIASFSYLGEALNFFSAVFSLAARFRFFGASDVFFVDCFFAFSGESAATGTFFDTSPTFLPFATCVFVASLFFCSSFVFSFLVTGFFFFSGLGVGSGILPLAISRFSCS